MVRRLIPAVTDGTATRRAEARVNVAAIERNCRRLLAQLSRGTALCAVVKADGYGHGMVQSARAGLAGRRQPGWRWPTRARRVNCARAGSARCACS